MTETSAAVSIDTSKDATIYFGVGPTFMRNITYAMIKAKQLPYDYFNHLFILGEYVASSSLYSY